MTSHDDDIHFNIVKQWMHLNVESLNSLDQILILERAIHAIELRACKTLSSITLMVVLDRVLHKTKEKFPALSQASIDETNFLNTEKINREQHTEEELEALSFFIVELLRVLTRITADILTLELHKELMKVTSNDSGEP